MPSENYERALGWLLALVLILGLGLRVWMALVTPRYFDDHYVFNNITPFLEGELRPRHSYYGSLSYLPQALALKACDALHSWTGIEALAVRGDYTEGFSLTAFRIMRMFIVLYALASILVIYHVGRRLFSPAVGLAAAAVLAAYPQHLRSSIQLKPDMMALMFTAITLYWTAGAARNPRLSRYLLAGVGVGLATSAKYIGVAAALPLTVWALWAGFRDKRYWGWLPLAGLASIATFFALNPFASLVLRFGTRLVKFYGNRARSEGSNRLVVARGELDFLTDQHGWLLGAFLLLGTLLLVRRLWRGEGERAAALLPLGLYVGYPLVYALGMTLFRTHNLLPAMAGTALVCAFGMVRCGEWLLRRGAPARIPLAAALLGLLPFGVLLARPFSYVYHQLVPVTWKAAEKTLRKQLAPLGSRQVVLEPAGVTLFLSEGWQRPARTAAPSLAALPPFRLDLADAEAFPLSRLRGSRAAFYAERRGRLAPECVQEVGPQPFRSQGEPVVLLLHPWKPAGEAVPVGLLRAKDGSGELAARLPAGLAEGEVVSLELMRPEQETSPAVALQPGGETLPLQYAGRRKVKLRFLTPRFRYTARAAEVRLPVSKKARLTGFNLRLWRWAPAPCR